MFNPNVLKKLSHHAQKSLFEAEFIAGAYKSKQVEPIHLLISIFLEKGSLGSTLLKDAGIKEIDYVTQLQKTQKNSPEDKNTKTISQGHLENIVLSQKTKKILTRSFLLASEARFPYVGTEHIVYALVESNNKDIQSIFEKNAQKNQNNSASNAKMPLKKIKRPFPPFSALSKFLEGPEGAVANMGNVSMMDDEGVSALEQFCVDLNEEVREKNYDPLIGRQEELHKLIYILGRKKKNNALLLGEPGVGKTAIAYGLAERIEHGSVPPFLINKRVLELDLALVIAGTTFRGEFESRMKDIMHEVEENGEVILFIDEIHTLVGAGNAHGSMDAANMLKPALARGNMRVIGATTFNEYKKHIEKDSALERRFQPILVNEPSESATKSILAGITQQYERFHHISISPEVLDVAIELSNRYIPDRSQPDKSIDVLDEASSALKSHRIQTDALVKKRNAEKELDEILVQKEILVQNERFEEAVEIRQKERELEQIIKKTEKAFNDYIKKNRPLLTVEDITRAISRLTNIPLERISHTSQTSLLTLEDTLTEGVVGQKEALNKIARSLRRSYLGITGNLRPLGSFLLLGPTGVGKTHTAKILAETLFGDRKSFIQVNMSELTQQHSIASLLGSPSGYVGFGEGGKFTEKVRRKPHSVILFDEIEKAHPDILNILLQILDEGELADLEGRKVSFQHTIILLTSNIGSQSIAEMRQTLGFGKSKNEPIPYSAIESRFKQEVRRTLKAEILGRLDEVLVFRPLESHHYQTIIRHELENVRKNLLEKRVNVSFDASVVKEIAKKTKNATTRSGARDLKKYIHNAISEDIAKTLLKNTTPDKQTIFVVRYNKEKIEITPKTKTTKKAKKASKLRAKRTRPDKKDSTGQKNT